MLDFIFDQLEVFFDFIGEIIAFVFDGIITLYEHVTSYFRGLKLRKGRDIPFIADEQKLADLIHNAPVKDCGIFEATFNENTQEIENYRLLEADELDDSLRAVLGDEKLVVLS